jgi:anthranilate phosphoribosyltransferase
VTRQLVGVFSADYVEPIAHALNTLGCERALVAHGAGGLDELSASDKLANDIAALEDGAVTRQHARVRAEIDPDLRGGSASENAAELRALLNGAGRPGHRAAVLINAAAALYVARHAPSFPAAHALATQSIDSGAAREALSRLVDVSRSAP